jgi:hypothetical protein
VWKRLWAGMWTLYVSSHHCISCPSVQPSGFSASGASPSSCRLTCTSFS